MPSFLGRLLGLSFRTELLIMNLLGLVNSTLDWSPLKWTNQLERIWNLSLSQESFVVHTIGEDTIKTVLSWIVITRIVSAHVYTFTYVTNIYPIITWTRPNLLLPWLMLSFFKNVVLEVIVVVIGLLLWYEQKFSLFLFLEFIFVKFVPLILAAYNWYSNSCLFFRLRYIEKLRKLRRTIRSESNLVSNRLFAKIDDSRYRSRSLTTLLSCESYETYDSQDTISRILDDPFMTPAEKTMRILGLTEADVANARSKARERATHRRLTEEQDRVINEMTRAEMTRYFSLSSDYEPDSDSLVNRKDRDVTVATVSVRKKSIPTSGKIRSIEKPEKKEAKAPRKTETSTVRRHSRRKREGLDHPETKRTKHMKLCSSCHIEDLKTYNSFKKREARHSKPRQQVEKSCSPIKLQALFSCDCAYTEYPNETERVCCFSNNVTLRTSTPTKEFSEENPEKEKLENFESSIEAFDRSYVFTCDLVNVEAQLKAMNNSLPLMEKLLKNKLDILKVVKQAPGVEKCPIIEKSVQEEQTVLNDPVSEYCDAVVDARDFEAVSSDLTGVGKQATAEGMTRDIEGEENLKSPDVSGSSKDDSQNGVEEGSLSTYAQDTEKSQSKTNIPECPFGDSNIPTFYKDSMKVFDGCYEKDFASNSELQCLLQQLEKKEWNLFAGQTNLDTLLPPAFLKQDSRIESDSRNSEANSTSNYDKTERFQNEVSSFSHAGTEDNVISEARIEESQELISIPVRKSCSLDQMRHVCTQTDNDTIIKPSDPSPSSSKTRKKPTFKHKRLRDQSRSVSPRNLCSVHLPRAQSKSSVSKDRSKTSVTNRQKPVRPGDQMNKQPSMTKSLSYQSVCECKMQKLGSSSFSDSRFDDQGPKTKEKPKIESFGTVPLAQVARSDNSSRIETMMFRRKPPVYPKKTKTEATTQVSSPRKPAAIRKQESDGAKRVVEKQKETKKLKKGRVESLEEKEAREMRALKMYNEVTLLKDKKELDAKKKSSDRNVDEEIKRKLLSSVKNVHEDFKNRLHLNKSNLDRLKRDAEVLYDDYYVGKENLFTETDPSIVSSSKQGKVPLNVQSFSVSGEKYTCSNLLKINKVTDKLLDNFDRLHGSQTKQEAKKVGTVADADSRRQYTKYSKPKRLMDEGNLSVTSSKKMEGVQKGRHLERTPAKEDVRDETVGSRAPTVLDELPGPRRIPNTAETVDGINFAEISAKGRVLEASDKMAVRTIKSSADREVVSSWSSSTVEDGERMETLLEDQAATEHRLQEAPRTVEHARPISEEFKVPGEEFITLRSVPPKEDDQVYQEIKEETPKTSRFATKSILAEETAGVSPRTEEIIQRTPGRPALNPTNFSRNVNVSCLPHGVVLTNTNAQGEKNQRDTVDDRTVRLLRNAFSYRSMDSILNLHSDSMSVEDFLSDARNHSVENEFVCQTENEFAESSHPVDDCDICIITIDDEDDRTNSETEPVDSLEEFQDPGVEILSINIQGFNLDNLFRGKFQFLGGTSNEGAEGSRNQIEEANGGEEGERDWLEDRTMLEAINEDIFTNIKFPIKISVSDLLPVVDRDDAEETIATLGYVESVERSLGSLDEKGGEEEEKGDEEEIGRPRRQSLQNVERVALEDVFENENSFADFKEETKILEEDTSVTILGDLNVSSPIRSPEVLESSRPMEICLNRTFEVSRSKYVDEEKKTEMEHEGEVIETGNRTFDIWTENSTNEEEKNYSSRYLSTEEIVEVKEEAEEAEESFKTGEMEGIQLEDTEVGRGSEEIFKDINEFQEEEENSLNSEERNETFISSKELEEKETSDVENGKKTEISELKEEISMKIIFMFWLIVFFFYVRYFYRKIASFTQISRSTSTRRIFEIHSLSTLTSTLLEKTSLIETVQRENLPEEEIKNDEDSGELEEMKISSSNKDVSQRGLSSSFGHKLFETFEIKGKNSTEEIEKNGSEEIEEKNSAQELSSCFVQKLSETFEIEMKSSDEMEEKKNSSEEIEKKNIAEEMEKKNTSEEIEMEVKQTLLDLSEKVSENLEFPSSFKFYDLKFVTQRPDIYVNDEEVFFDSVLHLENGATEETDSNSFNESNEADILAQISALEERRPSALNLAEKEIETFRFVDVEDSGSSKSLLRNDQPETSKSVDVTAKIDVEDEGPDPKEVERSVSSRRSNSMDVESKVEELFEEISEIKKIIENRKAEENESKNSSKQKEALTPRFFERNTRETDSFDSSYTNSSAGNSVSPVDLEESSMEEFSIASNASKETT